MPRRGSRATTQADGGADELQVRRAAPWSAYVVCVQVLAGVGCPVDRAGAGLTPSGRLSAWPMPGEATTMTARPAGGDAERPDREAGDLRQRRRGGACVRPGIGRDRDNRLRAQRGWGPSGELGVELHPQRVPAQARDALPRGTPAVATEQEPGRSRRAASPRSGRRPRAATWMPVVASDLGSERSRLPVARDRPACATRGPPELHVS